MNNSVSSSAKNAVAGTQPVLAPGEIILGQLKNLDAQGMPLVDYDCNPDSAPQGAVSTLPVTRQHLGRQVALLFASGDLRRPVIMGFIHNPLDELLETYEAPGETVETSQAAPELPQDVVKVDGQRVVLEGQEEVVLKCGESSITLTKAGKIIIRGKYLLSRASGVNRILGGSVQVN